MGRGHHLRRMSNSGTGGFRLLVDGEAVVDAKGNYQKVPFAPVGSSLLQRLALRTWVDVTGGAGVVLVDGKEVKAGK